MIVNEEAKLNVCLIAAFIFFVMPCMLLIYSFIQPVLNLAVERIINLF